ncbi:unnamed protein product [Cunninghamella blakesleeana]
MFQMIEKASVFPMIDFKPINGVSLLLFHEEKSIRLWARKVMDKFSAEDHTVENIQFENIMKMTFKYMMNANNKNSSAVNYVITVNRFGSSDNDDNNDEDEDIPEDEKCNVNTIQEKDEIWKGLRSMMSVMTKSSLISSLTALEEQDNLSILDVLKVQYDVKTNKNSYLIDVMKTYSYLWGRLQELTWGKKVLESTDAAEYYTFIKKFFEHESFRSHSKIAHEGEKRILNKSGVAFSQDKLVHKVRSLVDWIFPFWYSLRMINDIEVLTNNVLDALLGYCQLDIWSINFKACAVNSAFLILENCINDNKVPFEKINEYASKWVPFTLIDENDITNNSNNALNLPSSLSHIPSVAQSILTYFLNNDTQLLRESFINLISSTSSRDGDDDGDQNMGNQNLKISSYSQIWKELKSKSANEISCIISALLSSYAPLVNMNADYQYVNISSDLLQQFLDQRKLVQNLTLLSLEYVTSQSWEIRKSIVFDPSNTLPIVSCLVSPDLSIYTLTCKLLMIDGDKENRNNSHLNNIYLDSERIKPFFNNKPKSALRAFTNILKNYMELSNGSIDTYHLVFSYARAVSSFLNILIGDEDGYMFQLLISATVHSEDNELNLRIVKSIWDNVWKVINAIFASSIQWASKYKPKEILEKVVPWMDIANQIIGCKETFQKIVHHDALDTSSILSAVDGLSSWIYVTRTTVLAKLVPLLETILQYLQSLDIKISLDAYDRLYTAATGINPSRLEQQDKERLFISLSFHEPQNTIYLEDSDDDDDDNIQWQSVPLSGTTITTIPSISTKNNNTNTEKISIKGELVTNISSASISSSSIHNQSTVISRSSSLSSTSSKPKQISLSESFKNTPPLVDDEREKKTYYSCRPNTKITNYFGNTQEASQFGADIDIDKEASDIDNENIKKTKDTKLMKKLSINKSLIPTTSIDRIEFSTLSPTTTAPSSPSPKVTTKKAIGSPTTLGLENMEIDSNDSTPINTNIDHSAAISTLANQPSSRVFPNAPKPTTYAVTSTGRKLRAPSMGYTKIQQLREESKAERRLGATVKSPSAAAALKRKRKNGAGGDDDDDDNTDDDTDNDDDDDDDETTGLMGLVEVMNESVHDNPLHLQQHGNVIIQEPTSLQSLFDTNQPRRSIKLIDTPTHTRRLFERKAQVKQQEKQRKLKVTPNIDQLYKLILSWTLEDTTSDTPPETTNDMFNHIKDTYDGGFRQYVSYFEPLLLLEMWHQILRAKEFLSTNDVMNGFILENRCHVNDFVDVNFTVPINVDISILSQDDLLCIANRFGPDFFTSTTMIRGAAAAAAAESRGHGWRAMSFFAKVISVSQRKNKGDVTVRCYFPSDRIRVLNSLSPKSKWQVIKVTSLSTVQREYSALYGLEHFELMDDILNPHPTPMPALNQQAIDKCIKTYDVNLPQASAIVGALQKKKGFTLIQGPPGTGKTKTILGMIVTLLDQRSILKKGTAGKLLVCAPSNAAVDEIAKRLKDGILTIDGLVRPKVVRIGVAESVNASVKDLLLERQVEKELEPKTDKDADRNKTFTARKDKVRETIRKLNLDLEQIDRDMAGTTDLMVIHRLNDKKRTLIQQKKRQNIILKEIEDDYRDFSRDIESSKLRVRQKIIGECDVVCATLSGSGHGILAEMGLTFDTVIVDEAAQAVEISNLIPLKYDCKRCILVGDPNQLPPTVISILASRYSYQQSLFVRLEKNAPDNVYLLSIQYRMHPEISYFPSKLFYQGRLKDGPSMAEKTAAPWHLDPHLPPYCFLNVKYGQERQGHGQSLYNIAEAEAAVVIVDMLACRFPGIKFGYKIGIITPYKQQVSQLKYRFERRFGNKILQMIDFNTVDGFQGQEKDIIIFSCVRGEKGHTNPSSGIGFLADIRRMNVGLTRAKKSLFILGNARSLYQDKHWGGLVNDARERRLLIDCVEPYFGCRMKYDFFPPNLFQADVVTRKTEVRERKHLNPIIVPYENENKTDEDDDGDHTMTERQHIRYNSNGDVIKENNSVTTSITGKKHIRYLSNEEDADETQREHSRRKMNHEAHIDKIIKETSSLVKKESDTKSSASSSNKIPSVSTTKFKKAIKAIPITPPSNNLINHSNLSSNDNHNNTTQLPSTKKVSLDEYNKIRTASTSKSKSSGLFIPKNRNGPSMRGRDLHKHPYPRSNRGPSYEYNHDASSSHMSAKERVHADHQAQKDRLREYRKQEAIDQNRHEQRQKNAKSNYTPITNILDSYHSK